LLDTGRDELVGEDSCLHAMTSRRQDTTSRCRLPASHAASATSRHLVLPLASRCGSCRVGFDPEGATRGFNFFLWPGLTNEANIVSFLGSPKRTPFRSTGIKISPLKSPGLGPFRKNRMRPSIDMINVNYFSF
jgi:hypothetical protein